MVVRILPLPLRYMLLGALLLGSTGLFAQNNPQRATMTPFVEVYQQQASGQGGGSGSSRNTAQAPVHPVYTPPARNRKPKGKNEKARVVTAAKPQNVRRM